MTGPGVHRYHPARPDPDGDGLTVDTDTTVEAMQHRPGETDALLDWTRGDLVGVVNGAPLVLLPGTRPAADRLVGLGDYAVHTGTSWVAVLAATGFGQRYQPAADT